MSSQRPPRKLKKKFIIYCEGDAEANYISGLKKWLNEEYPDVAVHIDKPRNMRGGGYSSFLEYIKTKPASNCVARFAIIDFDKCVKNQDEKVAFYKLTDYCVRQNKTQKVPCFLIVDNPDFEFTSCLHCSKYKRSSSSSYITQVFGYRDLSDFKKDKEIWSFLNRDGRSFERMLDETKSIPGIVQHQYSLDKKKLTVKVGKTFIDRDAETQKGSNFFELFDIVLWGAE